MHRAPARPPPRCGRGNAASPCWPSDLVDAGLGEVEMLVEYQLPLTSKRADVVLAGVRPAHRRATSYVVVELKQWSQRRAVRGRRRARVLVDGIPRQPGCTRSHRCAGYCEYLRRLHRRAGGAPDAPSRRRVPAQRDGARCRRALRAVRGRAEPAVHRADGAASSSTTCAQRLAPSSGAEAADRLPRQRRSGRRKQLHVAGRRGDARPRAVRAAGRAAGRLRAGAARRRAGPARPTPRRSSSSPAVRARGKSVIALSLLGELYRRGARRCTPPVRSRSPRRCAQVAGATQARGAEPVQVLQQLHGRRARTASTC